jgi:hypothetical protein
MTIVLCLDAHLTCYRIGLNSSKVVQFLLIFRLWKKGRCLVDDWLKILLILTTNIKRLERQKRVYATNPITVGVGLSMLVDMAAVAVMGSTFVDLFGQHSSHAVPLPKHTITT